MLISITDEKFLPNIAPNIAIEAQCKGSEVRRGNKQQQNVASRRMKSALH